jgi:hypothetical protein
MPNRYLSKVYYLRHISWKKNTLQHEQELELVAGTRQSWQADKVGGLTRQMGLPVEVHTLIASIFAVTTNSTTRQRTAGWPSPYTFCLNKVSI